VKSILPHELEHSRTQECSRVASPTLANVITNDMITYLIKSLSDKLF